MTMTRSLTSGTINGIFLPSWTNNHNKTDLFKIRLVVCNTKIAIKARNHLKKPTMRNLACTKKDMWKSPVLKILIAKAKSAYCARIEKITCRKDVHRISKFLILKDRCEKFCPIINCNSAKYGSSIPNAITDHFWYTRKFRSSTRNSEGWKNDIRKVSLYRFGGECTNRLSWTSWKHTLYEF